MWSVCLLCSWLKWSLDKSSVILQGVLFISFTSLTAGVDGVYSCVFLTFMLERFVVGPVWSRPPCTYRHIHRDILWSVQSMVCASLSDQCNCPSFLCAYVTEDQRQQPVFSSQCQPSLSLHHTGPLYNTTDTMITSLFSLSLFVSLFNIYRHTIRPHIAWGFVYLTNE